MHLTFNRGCNKALKVINYVHFKAEGEKCFPLIENQDINVLTLF